jgi:hypothetical protein
MTTIIAIFQFCVANYAAIIAAISGLLSAIIVIALMIPGEQPEKALQAVVDFLAKFSVKK